MEKNDMQTNNSSLFHWVCDSSNLNKKTQVEFLF